jgi:hypothetical protein
MLIIGLLLVAAAVAFGTAVVIDNTSSLTDLDVFGTQLDGLSGAEIFLLGAASAAVFLVGLRMIMSGLRQTRRRRLEVRRARRERDDALRQQEEERRALEAERARLDAEKARLAGEDDRGVVRSEDTERSDSGPTRVIPRANTPRDEGSVRR